MWRPPEPVDTRHVRGSAPCCFSKAGEAGAAGGAVHVEHHEVGGGHAEIEVGGSLVPA